MNEQPDPKTAYAARLREARAYLEAIHIGLDSHEARRRRDAESWKHAHDLEGINEDLKPIAEFFGLRVRK